MNSALRDQIIIETYKATGSISKAQRAASCHYDTVIRCLCSEGLLYRDPESRSMKPVPRNVVIPKRPELPRVDRDPCPRCNTRKDIGCKHFPKQPEAQRPMTDRERAEAMWSNKS